jgi:hypothetical protein
MLNMILSAAEIKRQLIESDVEKVASNQPNDWNDKKRDYAEVGTHVKRMTGTNGWKLLETWLVRQLDINTILRGTDRDRVRAEAFADVLKQVNWWVSMGERANAEIEDKD